MTRNCRECNAAFLVIEGNQRYCNKNCRREAVNRRNRAYAARPENQERKRLRMTAYNIRPEVKARNQRRGHEYYARHKGERLNYQRRYRSRSEVRERNQHTPDRRKRGCFIRTWAALKLYRSRDKSQL